MAQAWDEDAYQTVAEYYDYVTTYGQRQDVPFFVDVAREAGSPVLEIGCGTGRILIPTARAGVDITGFDLSPAMLAVYRQKLVQEPQAVQARVQLLQGDMRDFDLRQTFALVTLLFRLFQHLLTVDDQLACLSCIHHHLQSGSRLVLDLFNPSVHVLANDAVVGVEPEREPAFTMPDGRRVLWQDKIVARDLFRQVQDVEIIYDVTHPEGRVKRLPSLSCSMRSVSPAQVARMPERFRWRWKGFQRRCSASRFVTCTCWLKRLIYVTSSAPGVCWRSSSPAWTRTFWRRLVGMILKAMRDEV